MRLTTKQLLIISAIVTVVIIGVGIFFYYKGKKQTTIQTPPLDNPDGGGNGNGSGNGNNNNPYAVSDAEISAIANALFEDMQGLNWYGHNVEPYQKLNSLSDTDFVKVYNAFNTVHQSNGGTLKEWIESESFAFDDVTDSIKERMGRLSLI